MKLEKYIFNFFKSPNAGPKPTHQSHSKSKSRKGARDICKGTSDTEFEQHWFVGSGATQGDGQKMKNYFSRFRDFSGKSR